MRENMKIGIIGCGHVGSAMYNLFKDAVVYDKNKPEYRDNLNKVNQCNVVFICVPTPMNKEDGSCNTSIVEEVISQCAAEVLVIRSTVYVGFCEEMTKKYNKRIVFQPEYYGETIAHPFTDLSKRQWLSFGGNNDDINMVLRAYETVLNAEQLSNIHRTDTKTAEMAKYMENAFLALKVTFCNEFYDICEAMNINYEEAREMWIADPRIGASHTLVYENNRGFGGSCLPKDLSSIIFQARKINADPKLLEMVQEKNKKYQK